MGGRGRGDDDLYYGDNLDVLRESIRDESVDLIYLDPPFNSNATYNILFRAPSGQASQAQIEAFEDTWHWNDAAERVRELGTVVDREKARIGVFISLEPHTQPMVKEAAGAGLYEGPTGKVPKIQLFTIEELLAGKRPRVPLAERAFKATAVEDTAEQDELDL